MIKLNNVTKNFDDFTALNNVSLEIKSGTAFGLIGSNGAGKSTILRILTGIYSIDSGEVSIDDSEVFDNINIKQRVFFINDETVQFANMNLKQLKDFYKGFYPNFSEEIFENLRSQIKLPMNKRIDKFSKGMKRQAIIIVALACGTDFLFLDEAFDGIDPTMRIIVKRMLIEAMLDRNLTTIISSHNLKEINELCDTAALIHAGEIVFCRDLDSLKGNAHKLQLSFKNEVTKEDLSAIEILHYEKNQSVINIIAKGDPDLVKAEINKFEPIICDMVPLTLEEIFIYEMEVKGYDFKQLD